MNENDAYIFEVEEPGDWSALQTPFTLRGWFLSKQDAVFSDLRAMIDGVPHLGLWGLPRPEIEKKHRRRVGLPHAGFELHLSPSGNARLLRLELRDAGGNWVEIWRQKLRIQHGSTRNASLNLEIVPGQLRKLLQQHRHGSDEDLTPLARRLALESAARLESLAPQPPFYGALEKPLLVGPSLYGKLNVEGWVVHHDLPIRRLIATTHPDVENELDYGDRARPEIGARFPHNPHAAHPQFFGMVDIDPNAGDPAYLHIMAEMADGSRQLVFAHRFFQQPSSNHEQPLPPYDRALFSKVTRLFAQSCRQQNISLGGWLNYRKVCRKAREQYRQEASQISIDANTSTVAPYAAWVATNQITPTLDRILRQSMEEIGDSKPTFVVLVDTRGTTSSQLRELTASLDSQLYPAWESWFVGQEAAPRGHQKIHSQICQSHGEYTEGLNLALQQSRGTHVIYLRGHSRISVDAFLEISLRLSADPTLELVYTDEDRMDDAGERSAPFFKPAWSPALALSGLYPGNLSVIKKERLETLGGFRGDYHLVPWVDVLWRLGDTLTAEQVAHIPLVCHHGRGSIALQIDLADPAIEQTRKALDETMRRRNWDASAWLPESAHHRRQNYHQLRWSSRTLARQHVTIVIPTRDRLHLLQECVELLDETVDWSHVKLVIVDDHSRDTDILRYLEAIQCRQDLHCTVVRPEDPHAPFNYSKLVNAALPFIDTPLILHLNNDVNALERGWVEEMAGWFDQEDVGIVGAKLIYPDKTLNHTGIIIGPHGGLADTPFAKIAEDRVDPIWHAVAREVSAVTGACLMTRTSLYRQLGGFDEADLGVAYNDVDYCLRVRESGHRVIYTPQAKLMHWGSATRGVTFNEAEHIAFLRRYPGYLDPYFSANWKLDGNLIVCAGARHGRTERIGKLHLLLITHNLNLEGAPLFILEYARWMVREAGFTVEILSAQEGPLRSSFEEFGATVTIINAAEIYGSPDEETFHIRVAEIAHRLDWDRIDLVVCNTLANFWGVHLARLGRRPSLFYIHESTSIPRFFKNSLPASLLPLVSTAFMECTRALFLCEATRAYYEDLNVHHHFRIVPSWIELDKLDEFRSSHPRSAMREKFGFKDDEIIIANIGTVCERKGQHIFIRAVEHFNRLHPDGPPVRFVLVGARPGIYLDLLKRDIANLNLTNITLVPETREVLDHFIAADMFVCSSYEESFPRVLMESMALRTPIVSTDVHGIPELVQQRADAYLVPPGDAIALSRMMWTCLVKERSGKSLAPTAYSRVLRYQNHRLVLPRHVRLAKEACLSG